MKKPNPNENATIAGTKIGSNITQEIKVRVANESKVRE